MKSFPLFLLLVLSLSGLSGQELDFLDKVNEKPKSAVVPKPAEEEADGSKKSPVVTTSPTTTGKKKKEKKKKAGQVSATETNQANTVPPLNNPQITTTGTKPIPTQTVPAIQNQNPVTPKANVTTSIVETEAVETSPTLSLWLDPEIKMEPSELPGFASESETAISLDKTTQEKKPQEKEGSGFSGFFDKYKKAMLILGFIILFAFYRAKMSRPSSNPRSYRK